MQSIVFANSIEMRFKLINICPFTRLDIYFYRARTYKQQMIHNVYIQSRTIHFNYLYLYFYEIKKQKKNVLVI